jgi:hypothetical protein
MQMLQPWSPVYRIPAVLNTAALMALGVTALGVLGLRALGIAWSARVSD